MRYLILSDIHSNLEALQAVVAAAEGQYEDILCLGDIVGYGPDPNAVTDWVRKNCGARIRGNHDKAACRLDDPSRLNYAGRVAIAWTQEQLTPENLQFLAQLPAGPLRQEEFQIVHGSVRDEDKYIVTQPDAIEELRHLETELVFFGHSHHQGGYMEDANGYLQEVKPSFFRGRSLVALELLPGEKYFLNPGSVGQPRDGDTRAAFAIYDRGRRRLEYWRVPYCVEAIQRRMMECGLPESLVQRLSFGH